MGRNFNFRDLVIGLLGLGLGLGISGGKPFGWGKKTVFVVDYRPVEDSPIKGLVIIDNIGTRSNSHKLSSPGGSIRLDKIYTPKKNAETKSDCIGIENKYFSFGESFTIDIPSTSLDEIDSDGFLEFKVFEDLAYFSDAILTIRVNGRVRTPVDSKIRITKRDYQENGDMHSVSIEVFIEISSQLANTNSTYSTVAVLVDEDASGHINEPIEGYEDLECEERISEQNLQYYQCLASSNGHIKDHIMIMEFSLCTQ